MESGCFFSSHHTIHHNNTVLIALVNNACLSISAKGETPKKKEEKYQKTLSEGFEQQMPARIMRIMQNFFNLWISVSLQKGADLPSIFPLLSQQEKKLTSYGKRVRMRRSETINA